MQYNLQVHNVQASVSCAMLSFARLTWPIPTSEYMTSDSVHSPGTPLKRYMQNLSHHEDRDSCIYMEVAQRCTSARNIFCIVG